MIFRLFFFTALISISTIAVLPDYNALPPVASINDLLNHAVAFFTLTVLYGYAFAHSFRRIGSSLLGYGLLIEVVQSLLPTRYASVEDVLADLFGILIGIAVMLGIRSLRERRDCLK